MTQEGSDLDSLVRKRVRALRAAHGWSLDDLDAFWSSIWRHFDVRSTTDPGPALADDRMPGARWFPGARLNWAEHCLRLDGRDADDVVVVGRPSE